MVADPGVLTYFPGSHLAWAVQESVLTLLSDARALKNPSGHVSHSGSALVVPAFFVNLPAGHLVS